MSAPRKEERAKELAKKYAANVTPSARRKLAKAIGLPAKVLDAFPLLGWDGDADPPCSRLPEFDADGSVLHLSHWEADSDGAIPSRVTHVPISGHGRGLYLPSNFTSTTGPILITVGAPDVAALAMCGIAAVGRPSPMGGLNRLAKLLESIDTTRPLITLGSSTDRTLDTDRPVDEALADKLAKLLGRPVRVAQTPDGQECYHWVADLAAGQGEAEDWAAIGAAILEHCEVNGWEVTGEEKKADQPVEAEPSARSSLVLPLLYYAHIAPALDAADFVEDLLIENAMSVVYGDSGCGKTFLMLSLALHVAAGIPWFGRAVDQRGVLYLALEGSHGIKNRVAAFKAAHLAGEADLPFAVVPVAVDLMNPAVDTSRVIETAKAAASTLSLRVGHIVVDTLSRALAGGNENSPEDMGAYVRNVDRIRQELPSHVNTIHHSGKDGARGARGHSLLRAATDTEIEVVRDATTGVAVARVSKQRELDCNGEFAFRLESVQLGTNRRGKPVTSCIVRQADPPVREDKLTKDEQAAINVLFELIGERGRADFPGVPSDTPSVPEVLWREQFYERCKPGASPDARKRAYRRPWMGSYLLKELPLTAKECGFSAGTRRDKTGLCPDPILPGQNGTGVFRPVPFCPAGVWCREKVIEYATTIKVEPYRPTCQNLTLLVGEYRHFQVAHLRGKRSPSPP